MDSATLAALKGSIAKWEAIVAGTATDRGPDNCPLCLKFWKNNCAGCPVAERVDDNFCDGSPYAGAWQSTSTKLPRADDPWRFYSSVLDDDGVPIPAAVAAAQAELDFLRGLLP